MDSDRASRLCGFACASLAQMDGESLWHTPHTRVQSSYCAQPTGDG